MPKKDNDSQGFDTTSKVLFAVATILFVAIVFLALRGGTESNALTAMISPSSIQTPLPITSGTIVTVTVTNGTPTYTLHPFLNSASLGVITETTNTFTLSLPIWYVGTYTFYFTMTDSTGASATSNTVTITVSP